MSVTKAIRVVAFGLEKLNSRCVVDDGVFKIKQVPVRDDGARVLVVGTVIRSADKPYPVVKLPSGDMLGEWDARVDMYFTGSGSYFDYEMGVVTGQDGTSIALVPVTCNALGNASYVDAVYKLKAGKRQRRHRSFLKRYARELSTLVECSLSGDGLYESNGGGVLESYERIAPDDAKWAIPPLWTNW